MNEDEIIKQLDERQTETIKMREYLNIVGE